MAFNIQPLLEQIGNYLRLSACHGFCVSAQGDALGCGISGCPAGIPWGKACYNVAWGIAPSLQARPTGRLKA